MAFRDWLNRKRWERQMDRELRFHLDAQIAEYIRDGMEAPEAEARARREFGMIALIQDECRDARKITWIHDALQDLRCAARMFARSPGFTAVAVLTLAVGIGVNAVVFTVANAVLFKGFPLVEQNDRLVYMTSGRGCCVSYPDFEDWRAQAMSFVDMALVHGIPMTLNDDGSFPERIDATEITAGTFALVGQTPVLGRDFTHADEVPGAAPVAVLRYSLWDRRFARDPAIVGRTIRLNGIPTTVIGVMPPGFSFPQNQDVWVPLVATAEVRRRDVRDTWFVVGRLRGGITVEQARAEMETIGRRLGAAHPATNQGRSLIPYVEDFEGFFIGARAGSTYRIMWVAVLFVLLIACANLAHLFLARAVARSREISVRMALGAPRSRIIRQLLTESATVAALGCLAGWLVARAGIALYPAVVSGSGISDQTPGTWFNDVLDYSMDYRVLAYLAVVTIGTGLLFGLAPALRISRVDVNTTVKAGSRPPGGDAGSGRLSRLLVTAEVALAVVLLAGAGVMVSSFLAVFRGDASFRSEGVVSARIELPNDRYPTQDGRRSFYERLGIRLGVAAGVESLALSSALPGGNTASGALRRYELADVPPVGEENQPSAAVQRVSPGYFAALGVRLAAGRDFHSGDDGSGLPVAIVNERFAARHWGAESPIGTRIRLLRGTEPEEWLTVVGVTPDIVRDLGPQQPDPIVYVPFTAQPANSAWVLMRTTAPSDAIFTAVRRELRGIDPELAIADGPALLAERLAGAHRHRAVIATLFLVFATVALMLASLGLYAVTAHSVSERTSEIGVRTALGASARQTVGLVLGQGMSAVCVGLLLGLAAWFAVARMLRTLVMDVSPTDPVNLAIVCTVLIVSSAVGCLIPAWRALRVDPALALRPE